MLLVAISFHFHAAPFAVLVTAILFSALRLLIEQWKGHLACKSHRSCPQKYYIGGEEANIV